MAFRAIAPALLFVPAMSIFRGFFQGIQKLQGFAITQIVEQLFRVIVGLGLAYFLFGRGLEFSAAGATFGATAGSIMGLIVSFSIYKYIKKREYAELLKQPNINSQESTWHILKQLFIIAIPITIGASIMPTMNSVDLMLVVGRLEQTGVTNAVAADLYGILTGFAVTIVNFPQILTASLQISLVPAITQLFVIYKKSNDEIDKKHLSDTVNAGIKTALIIGIPCAIGLVTLAEPVTTLLFSRQAESAVIGGKILAILGWDLIFLAVFQATTGILQGIKKQMLPAIHLAIGMIFKVILTYVLVGMPEFGITGAAISTVVAFAVASTLNVWALTREDYLNVNIFKLGIKPMMSGLAMGAFVLLAYNPLNGALGSKLATVITIAFAALIYGGFIIFTKTLSHDEYDMLPGGRKLRKLAEKLGR
jgi:stage V sporulation protein B